MSLETVPFKPEHSNVCTLLARVLPKEAYHYNIDTMQKIKLLVAGSPQLAALSVGGAVTYPSVLLQQFASNESTILIDLDTASWIGSIHGLAGIPSILTPTLMQWKGRKFGFIAACVVSIIGWILACSATNTAMILISESFHGLGTNSMLAVSLLSISEMVSPQFRNVSMVSFHVVQTLGMALVGILGRYLHWKTVGFIMGAPVCVAMVIGFVWPESPSWLACKGQFDRCEKAFVWLRGTDELSKKELHELITAQKALVSGNVDRRFKYKLQYFWDTLTTKDFYVPAVYIFALLNLTYWSGSLVILVYSIQMIQKATDDEDVAVFGSIIMNSILFAGVTASAVLIRHFPNKSVLLTSTACSAICLLSTSLVSYLQSVDLISKESLICLYLLVAYMIATSLGLLPVSFTVAAELMPVKHRGVGGALYVIFTCLLHSSSLKFAPYLLLYVNLSGILLIYALNAIVSGLFVWKFVPETKGKTLQEIEDLFGGLGKGGATETLVRLVPSSTSSHPMPVHG